MSTTTPLEERVAALIQRELNLGTDEVMTADTKLVGGDHDLDSLDVLMLVSAIEKEFGVKISNDEIGGRDVFEDVSSLSRFVASLQEAGATSGEAAI